MKYAVGHQASRHASRCIEIIVDRLVRRLEQGGAVGGGSHAPTSRCPRALLALFVPGSAGFIRRSAAARHIHILSLFCGEPEA
ncbi:hypothetical protein E2C01_026417 [Portunus trituberculatus]|uniref:Uncharacterized protein n=1 Tax=Portunus trituberculatus TaxID=210409 RepID=A0A5B7EIH9_PORTR|nr:hypothetical protein [Portunus trituberculatus]